MTRKITVLHVDDNSGHAAMVADYLNLQGNHAVDTALDVESARSFLASQKYYDVLLLDYRLPDGTGFDILDVVCKKADHPPVIMITGQGDEKIAAESIQRGASEYLVKGSNYLPGLPSLIKKVIREFELRRDVQKSLEKIRYQSLLLDNVREAVVVWNEIGQITFWNPAAEQLLGWQRGEAINRTVKEFYFGLFSPEFDLENDMDHEVERLAITRNGSEVWVSSRTTKLGAADGNDAALGFMDVVRDISERRKMEGLLQTMSVQLTQAARLAAIGELSSGIAHRISNPLATVIANAQLLKREIPQGNPAFDAVMDMEKAGWQVQQVVNQLLEFSRPALGANTVIDIHQSIENAINLVEPQIQSAGIRLVFEPADNLPKVWGVKRQIEDLWVTLLLLGRDAASSKGPNTIWIHSNHRNHLEVMVEVIDDGKPIPPDLIQSVFEPDFIGKGIGRGTGLEFSICREIVRQHHGQIAAKAVKDHNIVSVILPAGKTKDD